MKADACAHRLLFLSGILMTFSMSASFDSIPTFFKKRELISKYGMIYIIRE
ncbi:hypothetical protein B4140_4021 [Bacillus amyloliquefaciens]|nr:hypothetical protein B4140_4021 [Bacillus amyloliquefaciens]